MNSKTKTILCYGDSNTWGFIAEQYNPLTGEMARFPQEVRWPGRLKNLLGDSYCVIEEGLNGRTTNVDYPDTDSGIAGRNGESYLLPCLYSHSPIDLVILMLGTNDLKKFFNRSAQDVAKGVESLVDIILDSNYGADFKSAPKILLVAPPVVSKERTDVYPELFEGSVAKSQQFHSLYSAIAERKGCAYLNANDYVQLSSFDGIHFDQQAHEIFADKLAEVIGL